MWKKEGVPEQSAAPRTEATPGFERSDRSAEPRAGAQRASIGRSIKIKGEVTGDEDLLIQGRVDGSVILKQHSVTVGPEGEVSADITGRVVTIEGKVEGNLSAEEQIILRSSAIVQGDIAAPRVVLEDGARFRGSIDMGETLSRDARAGGAQAQTTAPTGRPTPAAADVALRMEPPAGRKEGTANTSAPVTR